MKENIFRLIALVMSNKIRVTILKILYKKGVAKFSEIKKRICSELKDNIYDGTLVYHLNVLKRSNLIQRIILSSKELLWQITKIGVTIARKIFSEREIVTLKYNIRFNWQGIEKLYSSIDNIDDYEIFLQNIKDYISEIKKDKEIEINHNVRPYFLLDYCILHIYFFSRQVHNTIQSLNIMDELSIIIIPFIFSFKYKFILTFPTLLELIRKINEYKKTSLIFSKNTLYMNRKYCELSNVLKKIIEEKDLSRKRNLIENYSKIYNPIAILSDLLDVKFVEKINVALRTLYSLLEKRKIVSYKEILPKKLTYKSYPELILRSYIFLSKFRPLKSFSNFIDAVNIDLTYFANKNIQNKKIYLLTISPLLTFYLKHLNTNYSSNIPVRRPIYLYIRNYFENNIDDKLLKNCFVYDLSADMLKYLLLEYYNNIYIELENFLLHYPNITLPLKVKYNMFFSKLIENFISIRKTKARERGLLTIREYSEFLERIRKVNESFKNLNNEIIDKILLKYFDEKHKERIALILGKNALN